MINPALISGLLQGGGALANIFGGKSSRKAGQTLGQIPEYGRQAYNPFIQQGQQATNQLNPLYQQFAGNPTDYYNSILGQYQPSAGYQYKQDKLNQMAHNTAASGGYAGTGGDVQDRSELFNALMGEDMQQFLQNILGIQGAGMQGLQHQADTGYNAAGSLADYLGGANQLQARNQAFGGYLGGANRTSGLNALSGLIGTKQNQGVFYEPLNKIFGGR